MTDKLTVAAASAIVGGLSNPSKMPGKAIGNLGSAMPDRVATARGYRVGLQRLLRMQKHVRFANVREAHARRLSAILSALADDTARARWIAAMSALLARQSWFRWH